MKFFAYDNPFMTRIRKLVDYMLLGMLWMIASIPVFTFGAATTAAIQTAELCIHRDEEKMFPEFWTCFRKEFKQATILWLLEIALLVSLLADIWIIREITIPKVLQGLIYVAMVVVFCWVQLWLGYLSKFQDTTRTLLKNTFRMVICYFVWAFLMALLSVLAVVGAGLCCIVMPPLLLIVPGIYLLVYTALLRKLCNKILPKEEVALEPAEAE